MQLHIDVVHWFDGVLEEEYLHDPSLIMSQISSGDNIVGPQVETLDKRQTPATRSGGCKITQQRVEIAEQTSYDPFMLKTDKNPRVNLMTDMVSLQCAMCLCRTAKMKLSKARQRFSSHLHSHSTLYHQIHLSLGMSLETSPLKAESQSQCLRPQIKSLSLTV